MVHPGPFATNTESRGASRRRRNRLRPGAESLEVRDCPSGLAPQLGTAETAHALHVAQVEASQTRAEIRHEAKVEARHLRVEHRREAIAARRLAKKKSQASPMTIYVATRGGVGANAGKNAAHPLGNLTVALKRAKAGSTIVLAPGTYNQAAGMTGKSDITIMGAANGTSVLAGAGAFALKIYSSSGITIENVSFRSPSGSGLAVVGSSVSLSNVSAVGNHADGLVVNGGGSVNVTSSHFDGSHTGDGMDVQGGSATISGSTFNGNGAGGSSTGGTGLSVEGNSRVNVMNSRFIGNVNANLVGYNQAQVTAQGSTFSNSQQGDGAIFSGQATVNLTGNTFATNGTVRGYASGFNGLEFSQYTGNAVISGNTFSDNTASGIFVGGSGPTLQIIGNTFASNLVGLDLDASVAPIATIVQGNTFMTTLNSGDQGLVAAGSGVSATIGGARSLENTFQNYAYQRSILQYHSSGTSTIGCPNLTIDANSYSSGGDVETASQAVLPC